MNPPHKIPAEQIDGMTSQLKGALKRRRPRTWLIVVSAMVISIVLLALLAWWLYNPTEPPRLEVIAFDAVATPDETPRIAAQLAFPEAGDFSASLLARRDMVFLDIQGAMLPGRQGHEVQTTSDAHGRAVVDWPRPAPDKPETILVRYVDMRNKLGNTDQATLFGWDKDSKVLLVDIEETLYPPGAKGVRPTKVALPAADALHEAQRKGYRIAYLTATAATPLEYRIVRGWIATQRTAKDGVPLGPVFGRREYPSAADADQARRDRLSDLRAHVGKNITFIARTAFAATAATSNQLRALILEPGENLPGATHVRGWAEVMPLLEKE